MKVSQDIIQRVKDAADIIEVIGEFVSLKRKGQNYTGLCPFHKEKTSSFTVSPEKGIYKCFGCGKAGNVFTFVSEYQGLNFNESLHLLAHKYNIDIPKQSDKATNEAASRNEIAYEAMNEAADFFHKNLRKKEGYTALQYFHKRDFNDDIIDKFLLGYSPNEWELLTKKLLKHGFDEDILIDTGLSIRGEKGNLYDRFRSRAMFTVRDFMGRVVGFGARLMIDDKSQPKYINSPQSLIYDKSKLLYGIYESKTAIRDKKFAIMVEGYADFLTMYRSGFENVVASSGTSLTNDQLNLLKRYSKSICFAYDGDDAGISAAIRGAEMAMSADFDVTIVRMPAGLDPDSTINKNGIVQMEYLIRDAESYIEFACKNAKQKGELESALSFSDFVRKIVKSIVAIPDSMQHDFHIRKLASILDLTEKQLRVAYKYRSNYIEELNKQQATNYSYDKSPEDYFNIEKSQIQFNYDELFINSAKILNEEKLLLNYALQGINQFTDLIEKYDIGPEIFFSDAAKVVFGIIQSHSDKDYILDSIMTDLLISEKVKSFIAEIAIMGDTSSENWYKRFNAEELVIDYHNSITDSKNKLKLRFIIQSISEIQQLMKDDEDNPNHKQRFIELLQKKIETESLIIKN